MTQKSQTITQRSVYYQDSEPLKAQEGDIWTDFSGNNIETNQYRNGSWELIVGEGADTPEHPAKGALWTDGSGTLRKYDGSNWPPVASDPLQGTDGAETFRESNVTVGGGLRAANESAEIDPLQDTRDGTSTSHTFDSTTDYDGAGLKFNPNTELAGVDVTLGSGTPNGEARLYQWSNKNQLDSTTTSGGTGSLRASLDAGTDYAVIMYYGNNTTYDRNKSFDGTYSTADADVVDSAILNNGSWASYDKEYSFSGLTFQLPSKRSFATGYVELDQPKDIVEWDKATYQDSPDGETIDVYLATSTDGGSTWSRINSGNPISRGYDLSSVSESSLVRFEVEISRADGTNNPTIDAVYRRWDL